MGHTLDRWGDSMEAFGDMIDARERAYAQRLPRVDALLSSGAVEKLGQRKTDINNRLNEIDSGADLAALGSAEERDQWARVQQLEAALAAAADNQDKADLRERLRLVKGVLYFRLNDSFKARMWQQRRTMKDLDLSLKETQEPLDPRAAGAAKRAHEQWRICGPGGGSEGAHRCVAGSYGGCRAETR